MIWTVLFVSLAMLVLVRAVQTRQEERTIAAAILFGSCILGNLFYWFMPNHAWHMVWYPIIDATCGVFFTLRFFVTRNGFLLTLSALLLADCLEYLAYGHSLQSLWAYNFWLDILFIFQLVTVAYTRKRWKLA